MTQDKLIIMKQKLDALRRKTSIAEASYKTGFIFAGKRMSVLQAKQEIAFLTQQINNNGNENNPKDGCAEEPQNQ